MDLDGFLITLLLLFLLALFIIYFVMIYAVVSLWKQVKTLKSRMADLELRMQGMPQPGREATEESVPPPSPADVPQPPHLTWDSSVTFPTAPSRPTPDPTWPGVTGGSPAPSRPTKPLRTRAEWELLIGGKWLNRVGAVALMIGLGFFLKYAFDHQWLNETARMLIGTLVTAALLGLGSRWHNKGLPIFAQGLFGAGVAIGYLTVYASFNFYHLVPQPVALLLMSAMTVLAFWVAIRHNSLAISVLGWAGGYLTPFLLSSENPNDIGLLGYIALLSAGLLWVIRRKTVWLPWLLPMTAGATYLLYVVWFAFLSRHDQWWMEILFLTLYWALFTWFDTIRADRGQHLSETAQIVGRIVAGVNSGLFVSLSYAASYQEYEKWDGLLLLSAGVLYFWLSYIADKRRWGSAEAIQYRMSAFTYAAVATAMFFSGATLGILWAIEAAAVARMGAVRQSRMDWAAASGLAFLAFWMWIDQSASIDITQIWPLLNQQTLYSGVLAASLAIGGWWARHLPGKTRTMVSRAWHAVGAFTLLYWISFQSDVWSFYLEKVANHTWAETDERLWTVIAWLLYALVMAWIGSRFRLAVPVWAGAGPYVLAVLWAMVLGEGYPHDVSTFVPVINIRFAAFVCLAVGGWLLKRQLQTAPGIAPFARWVSLTAHVAIFLLIWELLSTETMDVFDRLIVSVQPSKTHTIHYYENLQQLSLSGVWLLYSIALMVIGIIRRVQTVRMASIVLFGITILKIFILDLSFLDTLYRIFSFIGLGLILLSVSFVYQRYKDVLQLGGDKKEHVDG
ncbi:DUF2339 domain-containing protein [Polycladomyces subterraneus]|uniref:DUF2339 domain-containing protein n=1 Tax=Polycladomyces subterraneus TaxID=1016997 RepID=A0ABT8IKU6_9BACL|nr:DUF2339 domain-containing protein [Polycladomyces subterraneus]MDN4593409.1 DUF2339 domain-containing protein [Polycladomyces subterraneus]